MTKRDFLRYAEWLRRDDVILGGPEMFNGARGFVWDISDDWPPPRGPYGFVYKDYAAVAESLAYDNTDGPADEVTCDHGVTFDKDACKDGMTTAEVRRRWPRLMGKCPRGCGYDGIAYASMEHYVTGDW